MEPAVEASFETLSGYLTALGHPGRLELLSQLRIPRTVREMRLHPSRNEAEGNPDRAISRTAIERHLALLRAIGVVSRRPAERDGREADEWLVNQARLFQVIEELRDLTRLRPVEPIPEEATQADPRAPRPLAVAGPHLVVLSGPVEGRPLVLAGPGPWVLGRGDEATFALDHDPYVSGMHATIERGGDGFVLRDLPESRNGTFLNWAAVGKGGRGLAPGDILRLGRTLLVFRA